MQKSWFMIQAPFSRDLVPCYNRRSNKSWFLLTPRLFWHKREKTTPINSTAKLHGVEAAKATRNPINHALRNLFDIFIYDSLVDI